MHKSLPHWFTLLHFTLLYLASFFGILPLAENLVLKKGWINRVRRSYYMNQRADDRSIALH